MNITNESVVQASFSKVALVWLGTLLGGATLSQWVLIATLVYTVLNVFIALRKIWYERGPVAPTYKRRGTK